MMDDERIYILMEFAYKVQSNKPVIMFFSRDYENKELTYIHTFENFEPYFYVPSNETRDNPLITHYSDITEIDALGREVRKAYTKIPSDVPKVRDLFTFTDMSDFLFEKRCAVDYHIKYAYKIIDGKPVPVEVDQPILPRIVYFDIEVLAPQGIMPLPQGTDYPIVSIQCMDSYTKEIIIFTYKVPQTKNEDHIACANEEELIKLFMHYLHKIDPDIITAWNCLPWYTRVFSRDNGFIHIKNLKVGERLDDNNIVKHVKCTGNKEIYNIKTRIGWSIESSSDHKFLVRTLPWEKNKYYWIHVSNYPSYWKECKDVDEHDMIVCPFGEGIKNQYNGYDLKKLYLMGFIYGDGTLTSKYNYQLYNKDKSLILNILENYNIDGKDRRHWFSKGVWCATLIRRFYKDVEHFIVSNETGKKDLNIGALSMLSTEEFCAFVAGWYDADGSFWDDKAFMIYDDARHHQDICKLFIHFGMVMSMFGSEGRYNVLTGLPIVWETLRKHSFYPETIIDRNVVHRSPELMKFFRYGFTKDFSHVCIGIKRVEPTGKSEECYDIETSNHTFNIGCIVHNCSFYDLPYIIRRSSKMGYDVKKLGRYGVPRCEYNPEKGDYNLRITGRSTIDMLPAFKKFTSGGGQLESYALKAVIADEDILGENAFSYIDYGPMLSKLFDEENWQAFIEYCRNDVIALDTIDSTVNLFAFYDSIRQIAGCRLDDVLYNSKIIEMLFLHEGIKPMPRKGKYVSKEDNDNKIKGAHVEEPKPGVSNNMATFDAASLYPSIMIAAQKSPDIDGIVVKTLEKTMKMREDLRAQCKKNPDNILLENKQLAVKFLNNSYYGVLGLQSFRLYNREIASFVTRTGRELNAFMQSIAVSHGYEVIFGDTDSIGVISVNDVQSGKILEKQLNDALAKYSDERNYKLRFTLKFEKLFRRIFFKSDETGKGVKKKYCGHLIWEEGRDKNELSYKGLELKRSDQSNMTRECLRYFLEKLLLEDNSEDAVKYVKKLYNDVKSGNVDILEISLPKAIRKVKYGTDNPWVNGIEYAKARYNYILADGEKPRLLYLKYGRTICIDADFDTSLIKDDIDFEMMSNKIIKKKMESYIWSIGYTWEGVVNGQQSLTNWY